MPRARFAVAPAVLLLLASLPARVEPAETPAALRLSYHIWQGGFHALTLTAATTAAIADTRDDDPGDYRTQVLAETNGLIGWLYPYSVRARSEGRAGTAQLSPRYFETRTDKAGRLKARAVTYRETGAHHVYNDPPRDDDDDDDIPETLLRGALDPLSAVISAIQGFSRRGRCAGRVPVFDGRRRYDLVIKPLGPGTIEPSEYGAYSGPATRCRVAVKRVAGFDKGKRTPGRMPIKVDVWLAPMHGQGPALPVRIEGENRLGHVVVHLVSADAIAPAKSATR